MFSSLATVTTVARATSTHFPPTAIAKEAGFGPLTKAMLTASI